LTEAKALALSISHTRIPIPAPAATLSAEMSLRAHQLPPDLTYTRAPLGHT